MDPWPPIEELIPHRRPMLLIDEVIAHEGYEVRTRTTIREDMPFVHDGEMEALVAVELFAQSACTLVTLLAPPGARPQQSGAILGTRNIALETDRFSVGDVLEVHCEQKLAIGMTAQIACRLERDSEVLAHGSINVMAGAPK